MKLYAINLVVDTKNTDIYDKVALNKFPIIAKCKTEDELKDVLSADETVSFIKHNIKSKRVYDTALWMIRGINDNGEIEEKIWSVNDLLKDIF